MSDSATTGATPPSSYRLSVIVAEQSIAIERLPRYGPSQRHRKRDHGIAGRQLHYNNMLRSPFSSQAESLVPHQNHRRYKRPSKCVGELRTGLPRARHIKRVRHGTFPHIPTTMRVRDQPVKSLPPGAIGSREEDQLRQADSWKVNSVGESASVYPGYGLAAERK